MASSDATQRAVLAGLSCGIGLAAPVVMYAATLPFSSVNETVVAGAVPFAVGAVAGVYVSQGIRVFDSTTIALSVLTGVGAVLALYALTSAIIALSMRKARPKQLMAADGR